MLGLYARGGHAWSLGFIALVPWLLALDTSPGSAAALRSALLMSIGFVAAVFPWFAFAVSTFTGIPTWAALGSLLLGAPLLQPQVLVFALVRCSVRRRHGAAAGALAGAAAWVAAEWALPKLLGDTLGHGLSPAATLRQVADLGGAAGLSVLLILVNECMAAAVTARGRAALAPLALAACVIAAMWGYGAHRLHALSFTGEHSAPLRVAIVQANIVDYERLRRESGAYAVVRRVLDTHFAMSQLAIDHQHADALLWSETVYPTTFGHAKSADGAALDGEILGFVQRSGVPLVFGSYDVDAGGEYNAAFFVDPVVGMLGTYRKTRPFPLTEHVPPWIDGRALRRALPWAGTWQRGDGPRVFPVRLLDGRQVPVSPLICLDAVDPQLAIGSARLGAHVLFVLSNDAWFTAHPQGARLHLAVSAFRSIETRMPQLRATTNGISAVIDRTGAITQHTHMDQRALLVGEVQAPAPPMTLMVRWGDWVGRSCALALLLFATWTLARAWHARRLRMPAPQHPAQADARALRDVALLTPAMRLLVSTLQLASVLGMAWLAHAMLVEDGLRIASLSRIWMFAATVAAPALAAWALLRASSARLHVEAGNLVLAQGARFTQAFIEVPIASVTGVEPWRIPLPSAGAGLFLASGRQLPQRIAMRDPEALRRLLADAGASLVPQTPAGRIAARLARIRASAPRWRIDAPWCKFVLFPLLPALVAFRLHQHIAFGGTFGEWLTYGPKAWFSALLIWWASWCIGLVLLAALLRVIVELVTLATLAAPEAHAITSRRGLVSAARAVYFLGVPLWLVLRLLSN